jgi:hypothetical protein
MSHKTLIITSSIFVVIILVGVIISFTLLLHPNTPNRGGVASTSTQTTQSLVSVVPQRVVLGVLPNPHNSSTQVLPADTLVWETYTLSNTTILVGAEIAIVILPQNYNSNITLAVYVNGTLLNQETYKIPPPIGNDNSSSFVYGGTFEVPIERTVSSGSIVALAVFSQTPITVYVSNSGSTFAKQINKLLPYQLPASASVLPYLVEMYAYTNA